MPRGRMKKTRKIAPAIASQVGRTTGPLHVDKKTLRDLPTITMTPDEVQALKYRDLDRLSMAAAAKKMGISKTVFAGIYTRARVKQSDAMINGKILTVAEEPNVATPAKKSASTKALAKKSATKKVTAKKSAKKQAAPAKKTPVKNAVKAPTKSKTGTATKAATARTVKKWTVAAKKATPVAAKKPAKGAKKTTTPAGKKPVKKTPSKGGATKKAAPASKKPTPKKKK